MKHRNGVREFVGTGVPNAFFVVEIAAVGGLTCSGSCLVGIQRWILKLALEIVVMVSTRERPKAY